MNTLHFATGVLCAALLSQSASAAVPLPGGQKIEAVDFERHVMAVFSKAGCNLGSCHGSFQGKGGFRLSLFGYDAAMDYKGLARDVMGRRVNAADPDQSLVLLKATGQVPHEGGVRFGRKSWQYQVLREWIAAGAAWRPNRGQVVGLTIVDTTDQLFVQRQQTRRLVVKAKYADGGEEVVTTLCEYKTTDDAIAEVTPLGEVTARGPGDTGLTVSYRGAVAAVRVLVPMPAVTKQYPKIPEVNFIDREVFAKLRKLNMIPSDLSDDAEFLRRVTIDTIGILPTPDEVRAFLADKSPDKRTRKIDELLAHPLHAAVWATKLSDITGNNTEALEQPQNLKPRRSQQWHDWLRARVAENRPWDEIVRRILTATSRDGLPPEEWVKQVVKADEVLEKSYDPAYADRQSLDLFWRRQQAVPLEQWGEKVAAAFLGVRLECAQCHKHPTDRWTQADYRAFANLFQQVSFGSSPESKKVIDPINAERKANAPKNNQINQVREVYLSAAPKVKGKAARNVKVLKHPDTDQPLPAKALGGPEVATDEGDARGELWKWMRSPDNPFFARSFVNRVWAHYFGIGLVDPVDDFSVANPPSNARLLDALAKDFVASGYDIRALERRVLQSRTYQLSSRPNATNADDTNNFARAYIRPMMAEVVVDVLNAALGSREQFGSDAPKDARMTEVGSTRLANGSLAYVLRVFGRPPRSSACDCERSMDPALPQTLYRMTDPAVLAKIRDPKGRLTALIKNRSLSDDAAIDELFLATLSRFPTADERAAFARHRAATTDRAAYLTDAAWALINTREFILNH